MDQKKNRWKWIALVLMIVMIGCLFPVCAFADAGTPGDAEQVAAVILHTNDAHVAFEDNIGYDGLAPYKKELEAVYDHVLLIDAGDAIQGAPIGSVSKGAEIIRMMNRLGYDLAVPGNHEFDYGLEALDDCAEALDCGYTCANFCVTGGEPVFQPWRILEAGDLKIGFVGAVTPDAYTKSTIKDILNEAGEPMYDFLADETGQRLCIGLQKAIDETRQAGADYVILVSHLGNNDSITEQFRTDAVVGKLRGLDLIIDGHSHETYNRIAGDMFRGSLIDSEYQGISTIQIMNMLAPDVVSLGNHEVDYGLAHLLFLERCASFPIICANMYVKYIGKRLFSSHWIKEIDGMRVLFIGILTEEVLAKTKTEELIGTLIDLEDAAQEIGKICDT